MSVRENHVISDDMSSPRVGPLPSQYSVVVKSVYDTTDSASVPLVVAASMTIGELKSAVQGALADSPSPTTMRLIFGGRICLDDTTVGEILAQVCRCVCVCAGCARGVRGRHACARRCGACGGPL